MSTGNDGAADAGMLEVRTTSGAILRYRRVGEGFPVLALHGAYSAHEEIRAFLDQAVPTCRRLYPDLPGMGESTADGVSGAAHAVDALDQLIEHELGDQSFVIVGHSFGAHLARGVAARRPRQVCGLVLICPWMPAGLQAEEHVVVADDGTAAGLLSPSELAEFTGYFVVQTAATVARFRAAVSPVLGRYDSAVVERLMARWSLDPELAAYDGPVLVVAGRHDSTVGFRQGAALLAAYPRASSLVLADAGHALPHEHPDLLAAVLRQWLAQATGPTPP